MQHKRLAAALIVSLPLAAFAQSNVQLYGIMDAAVSSEDNGVARHTVVNSGNQSSSRFGFRGTEDLGNGMKALFNLEGGVAIDTGAADSSLFGRRAVVGLEGGFGTLTIGREYSPIASVAGATDITGQGFYGSNLSAFNYLTRRLSNSVNYRSADLSGFKVLAAYSAGEAASGQPKSDLKGVGLEYAQGNLYVGGAYHTNNNLPNGGDTREYAFGAAYKFGDIELKGNYLAQDPDGANNKFTQYNLGAAYAMGAGKFFVNLQQNKLENGARGNGWNIDYSYALSKRTNLYTGYARLDNNSLGNFALNSSSIKLAPGKVSADPSVFNVGIRHTF
ncbi:MAG: porin [Telluria sp.]